MAAAAWLQIADRGSDGIESVQGVAKFVQRQGLHMPLDVGGGLIRIALGEGAQL